MSPTGLGPDSISKAMVCVARMFDAGVGERARRNRRR